MLTTQLAKQLNSQDLVAKVNALKDREEFTVIVETVDNMNHCKTYRKTNRLMVNFSTQFKMTNEELEENKIEILETKAEKVAKQVRVEKPKPAKKEITYMQSKTGMYHITGYEFNDGMKVPACQSYNLDRANKLQGEKHSQLPEGAKLCKKCATRLK